LKALNKLHPVGPQLHRKEDDALPEALVSSTTEIKEALQSFPAESSPGPSGLSAQHLKDAVMCQSPIYGTRCLETLTDLVNMLAAGEGVGEVKPFLAGGSLTPLRKDDDGVRPIALGETLRRLVAQCLIRNEAVGPTLGMYFLPTQVGVGVPGGAEATVHAVKALVAELGDNPDKALLKIDFENAFNKVSREAFVETVEADFPGMSRWVRWCYEEHSNLWVQGQAVTSQCGTQQETPLDKCCLQWC